MKKFAAILVLTCNSLFLAAIGIHEGNDADQTGVSQPTNLSEPANGRLNPSLHEQDLDRTNAYQMALEKVAATKSMQQLHANYAKLGSPFKEMTTVQFADLFHRSQGFTVKGTAEIRWNMYQQGWSSDWPALNDPEPDDCTPEEIEAWYRQFYDPWHAQRPSPEPWAHELPFVDPQPNHLVKPGFQVIGNRGYRWGLVYAPNAQGDFEPIGQVKPDYRVNE